MFAPRNYISLLAVATAVHPAGKEEKDQSPSCVVYQQDDNEHFPLLSPSVTSISSHPSVPDTAHVWRCHRDTTSGWELFLYLALFISTKPWIIVIIPQEVDRINQYQCLTCKTLVFLHPFYSSWLQVWTVCYRLCLPQVRWSPFTLLQWWWDLLVEEYFTMNNQRLQWK